MFKRPAFLMVTAAFLSACAASAPPPAAAPPPPAAPPPVVSGPPAVHQSQEKPKLPELPAAPDKDPSQSKVKLTFDVPPTWSQVSDSLLRKPWKMGFVNPEANGLILMDFDPGAEESAAKTAAIIADGVCKPNGWKCSKPKALADGSGASFTYATAKSKGKITVRDLKGNGKAQMHLFGQWAKDKDLQSSKDFDTMILSAKLE